MLEVVDCSTGCNLIARERHVEVVIEVAFVGRNPGKAPPITFTDSFYLPYGGASYGSVADIVMLEVGQNSFDMINFESASDALMLGSRSHHEVFEEKLAAILKQIRKRDLSCRTIEDVLLVDFCPGQTTLLRTQLVA